jgi:hypothetical protein
MAYVYFHIRKSDGEIFYVGIGRKKDRHISKKHRNNHWKNYTNKYSWYSVITHDDVIWEEACSIEKYLISFYGRKDMSKGGLLNMTDGGEGLTAPSEETIEKFRKARRGKKIPESQKEKLRLILRDKKPVNRKKVIQLDFNGTFIARYDSVYDAHIKSGVAKSSISKCCKGSLSRAGKFVWIYE